MSTQQEAMHPQTGHTPDARAEGGEHPYALMGVVVLVCTVLAALLSGAGYVGLRFASVQSVMLALLLVDLVTAAGLTYALFTLRKALESEQEERRPYSVLGAVLVVTIALIFAASFLGVADTRLPATTGFFLWLGATGLILAGALAYLLFTLGPSLDPRHDRPRPYPLVGRLVLGALGLSGLVATIADVNIGLLGTPAALFGLALLRFASALALVYMLFVLDDSLAELRFQRRSTVGTTRGPPLDVGATADATPAQAAPRESGETA